MNKKYLLVLIVGAVVVILLVVSFVLKGGKVGGGYDTIFPMPSSVSNFTKGTDGSQVNFQTSLNLKQTEEFYRTELTKMGLTERTINTSVTEDTFSMVFDGHESGKAVVVQGVNIQGKTNVNIRLEAI
ncbi:hypothetical protein A2716_02440 [candidate division WWE3 bacterium RIFCSPHIGHO2_01_FULL_40_23]|uniref:Uncharacterized protein n=1 Tax=candidate division WWE3 bacterium RIFCSPLOWO2_01_FULL_41_18 TaxID=1802625 RepID=A0A1F4VFA7_UNCKA|nr:MAG: hypothetical protein A2716_02440 [candidate division WWE3 bacterium RIFCSPHIGHO2_01_FULL_40_23]OGC55844.1 MAG: hypothetical protein A3A78_02290 [candidate division WWE3 bacterium RIFCSPLOWO2_01_FULL_41_18]